MMAPVSDESRTGKLLLEAAEEYKDEDNEATPKARKTTVKHWKKRAKKHL